MMNKQTNIIELNEQVADLEYDIALLQSEIKGCENQEAWERAVRELQAKRVELAALYDTGFNA